MFSKAVAVVMTAIIASFIAGLEWDTAQFIVLIPAMAGLAAVILGEA